MKHLVTGGAGFIGSTLVDKLIKLGHEVVCVDNESAESSDVFYWNDKAENHKIDILDKESLASVYQNIDCVFHLAAETRIVPAIKNPQKTFDVNVMGSINLLELVRKNNTSRIVISSSSAVYGLNQSPNIESDKTDCLNPYASSKLCVEEISKMYHTLYDTNVINLRYFNVYGERMPSRGQYAPVIGIFFRQKENQESLTVVGDGKQSRDFVHVGDVANANIAASMTENKYAFGDYFNVGTSECYDILTIAKMINGENYSFIPERKGEARSSVANINKIRETLEWLPSANLENWIKELI
ncbi:MAG: NAD-dependent epimerase/dehydratase family protein [Proteobacteria bacterium]|nr:NAD-dependent epimerase/dehydratase family protein [Pseudomonadota bacterium]